MISQKILLLALVFEQLFFFVPEKVTFADSDVSLNLGAFFAGSDSLLHLGNAGDSGASSSSHPAEMTIAWHDHFSDPLGIFVSFSSYGFNNIVDAILGPFAVGVQMAGVEAISLDAGYSFRVPFSEEIEFIYDLGPSFVALQNTSSSNTSLSNTYLNFGIVQRIGAQVWLGEERRSAIAAYINSLCLPWGNIGPAPGQAGTAGPVLGNIVGLKIGYVRAL